MSRTVRVRALAFLHPAGAPAGVTTGGSSHAGTIHHVHSRPTCFADGNDRLICLFEVRKRHSDCRCRQGQSKRNRYQLSHYFSPSWPLSILPSLLVFGLTRAPSAECGLCLLTKL